MLYSFLVLTKCQVLNLRVGRSCDQVLQRAQSNLKNDKMYILKNNNMQRWRSKYETDAEKGKETEWEKESKIRNK